jgi:hypothetical protein
MDETYSLVHRRRSTASTNAGRWGIISGASLCLYPFFTSSSSRKGVVDVTRVALWSVTSVPGNLVAPFGGDSSDPRQWAALSRARVKPLPEPFIGAALKGWLAVIGAGILLPCLRVLLWWKARTTPRGWRRESFSGSNVASAVLPQIERLRSSHHSGAPVPARHTLGHKSLIAAARRFVVQLAYFRKPEDPDPAIPDEPRDHTA